MCGRAFSPRFLYTWPNSRISVMGGVQAANVLTQIAEQQSNRVGKAWDKNTADKIMTKISDQFEKEGSPYYSSARLWDDGIIDPIDTRTTIGLSLRIIKNNEQSGTRYGIFRM